MKAAVRHAYGPPELLAVEEVTTPTPADDELLVRVHAASVNLGEWEILTAKPLYIAVLAQLLGPKPRYEVPSRGGEGPERRRGLFKPKYKILGTDFAGRIEAVGRNVTQFKAADEVFGECEFGAFAEYVRVPEKNPVAGRALAEEAGVKETNESNTLAEWRRGLM